MATIWLDGEWLDRDTAKVSVYDHGLLYGDGVFEGTRAYGGKVFRLREHLERLYDSARAVWLTIPMPFDEMSALTEEAVRRSGLDDAYIRHVITRGSGDLGLDPRKCGRATMLIIVDGIRMFPQSVYDNGLRVVTAGTPIPHREALSPRAKSLNYLPHILAKIEAINASVDEAIMLDPVGYVAEGSAQNLFIVKQGRIRTPPPYAGILKGVTRDAVIELAHEAGHPLSEELFNRYDVYTADEAFFTGTASEIIFIREVDGRAIGTGTLGSVTRDLTARFRKLTRG